MCAKQQLIAMPADYFDKHEQALKDTYRRCTLPLPSMTTSIDGSAQAIAEKWRAEMQKHAEVLITKRGDTMTQHAIDTALNFDKSGIAWLWDGDHPMDDPVESFSSKAAEVFANVFSEEALVPGQLTGSSKEHHIIELRTLDANDFPLTSTASWLHSLSHDTSALIERIDREHTHLTKRMNLEPQPSPLTR